MNRSILYLTLVLCLAVMTACSDTKVPAKYTDVETAVDIYPAYGDVTVPYNIAPLNFRIEEAGDEYVTRIFGSKKGEIIISGNLVKIGMKEWKQMMETNKSGHYSVEIYIKRGESWYKYPIITNQISPDPIDEYISYRLIEPSYVSFETLSINQRNLTNFEETEIYNSRALSNSGKGHCINCHAYQNYRTDNMQFHARQSHGGTMVVVDGKPQKVNLKTPEIISGGVYPSWHPTEKLIAYSVNTTGQVFHSRDPQKVEVQDRESDIILYDIAGNTVSTVVNDPEALETFPSWSPDGKMLYFVSAHFQQKSDDLFQDMSQDYDKIKYSILRIPFDPKTKRFGQQDTVFNAAALGKSATLPRISPDGRYLLFTLGDFGNFHIWHKSSDLHIIDLQTGAERKLENVNSPDVESYHTWSSTGRWIIFSSRRDDGSYTRPYIAYFGKDGKASEPFILPQENPDYYGQLYKSYNIPEFMVEPVKVSVHDFIEAFKKEEIQVKYRGKN